MLFRSTQQADDTQQVCDSMNYISNAIDNTVKGVETLGNSAEQMKVNNETVSAILDELIDISSRTRKSVDDVQEQTNLTNKSAQDIRSATDIIAGIASHPDCSSAETSCC